MPSPLRPPRSSDVDVRFVGAPLVMTLSCHRCGTTSVEDDLSYASLRDRVASFETVHVTCAPVPDLQTRGMERHASVQRAIASARLSLDSVTASRATSDMLVLSSHELLARRGSRLPDGPQRSARPLSAHFSGHNRTRARTGPPQLYVVAAETAAVAHAVLALVQYEHSISLCGEPAELFLPVPDLTWPDVQPALRCAVCDKQVIDRS